MLGNHTMRISNTKIKKMIAMVTIVMRMAIQTECTVRASCA